jgi:hypothetical protein
MKRVLLIIILSTSWIASLIWPVEDKMIDYCAYHKVGMQDVYETNVNLNVKLEEVLYYSTSIIECANELKNSPKEFRDKYLKATTYGNLKKLFN